MTAPLAYNYVTNTLALRSLLLEDMHEKENNVLQVPETQTIYGTPSTKMAMKNR